MVDGNGEAGRRFSASGDSDSSGRTISIVLFLAGLAQYFLRIRLTSLSALPLAFSIILFFLAGYALSKKAGRDDPWGVYIPMILFGLWYFAFGGDYSPGFLLVFLLLTMGILGAIAFLTKARSVKPELMGFLPVIFLFLDIGLLPFLVETLNWPITPLVEGLILWMPWWAFFGLLTLPSEASENRSLNFFLNALKYIGILYILAILVLPAVPNVGYDRGALPQAAELEEAQIRLRGKLFRGDNPAWISLKCVFKDPTSVQSCVQRETDKARYERICEESGVTDKTQLEICIKEEERKEKEIGAVRGAVSSIVTESTEIKFKEVPEEDFPAKSFQPRDIYPIILEIENPRREELAMEVKCLFRKSKENVSGKVSIEGEEKNNLVALETKKTTIECTPSADLEGTYDLEYSATLSGVNTPSYLKRAFIPEVESYQARQDLEEEIESAEFPRNRDALSQSPEDFARINFKFGSGTGSNPIVSADEDVRFSWGVENLARGKILRINGYSFDDLIGKGFALDPSKTGDADCLQGGEMIIPTSKITALKSCWLQVPGDLKNIDNYVVQTFGASFNYDYELTHTIRNIKVEILE